MEPGTNFANLEALLNILSNAGEILGIAGGGPLLLVSWMPAVCGLKGYWWKFLALALTLLVLGLASPGIVNFLAHSGEIGLIVALITGPLLLLFEIGMLLLALFAPIAIAYKEKLERKGLIIGLTLGSFIIPFCWLGALIVCGMDMRNKARESESLDQL